MKSTRLPLLVAAAGLLAVCWVGLRVTARAPDAGPDIDPSLPFNADALKELQAEQVEAFVSSMGFGLSRNMQPSMNAPSLLWVPLQLRNTTRVGFARQQFKLVSLLQHTPPAVYETTLALDNTHRFSINGATALESKRLRETALMAEKKAPPPPTRPLDAFEAAALKRLEAGEEVVAGVDHGQLRVLGAVRARESCVKCHEGTVVGTLLGAFTYFLVPNNRS